MFLIGTGKSEIRVNKTGFGMMGYGRFFHTVEGVDTPLYTRAILLQEPETGTRTVIVLADVCFISMSVKKGVLKRLERFHSELGLTEENLLLTAQHTHSGPGGYSHFGFYNLSIPGFVPEIYQAIVEGIVEAIVVAFKAPVPGDVHLSEGEFPEEVDIAFNRSHRAFNRNPEVKKVSKRERHKAVDRSMHMLHFQDSNGMSMAALNFFGVHTTSLPNKSHNINWDNKGYAAASLESEIQKQSGNPDFVALFGQGTAGDVTPNYIYDPLLGRSRGPHKDGIKNAIHAGDHQAKLAKELLDSDKQERLNPQIQTGLNYADFSRVVVDKDFAYGQEGHMTGHACIGIDMLIGTTEGPGLHPVAGFFGRFGILGVEAYERAKILFSSREERHRILRKYRSQGKKYVVIETGDRRVMGTSNVKRVILPGFVDGGLAALKRFHAQGGLDDKPWTPHKLPLQLVRIGSLLLATIPGEITTIAGKRLRETILNEVSSSGITKVILVPYSNAYSGYITTHEEYQLQNYEGGHTVFGQWTLAAYQTEYRKMARKLFPQTSAKAETRIQPIDFSKDELMKRAFDAKYARKTKKKKAPEAHIEGNSA